MSRSLESQKFIIAGGSGFLGISLADHLSQLGASVVILSRSPPKATGPWRQRSWDGRTLGDWKQDLNGASGLVNLTGRTVNCIKSPDHRDEILRSRVESTRVLGEAMRSVDSPPPVWVQMSTAHIYGDPPQVLCTEESALVSRPSWHEPGKKRSARAACLRNDALCCEPVSSWGEIAAQAAVRLIR